MKKHYSTQSQLMLAGLLVALAAILWVKREDISLALSSKQNPRVEKNTAGKGKVRTIPVIVAAVTKRRNDAIVEAIGTARARRSIMIFAKTEGVVTDMGVKAGDRVKMGAKIFKLESQQAELNVEIARKRLAEAKNALDRINYLKGRNVGSAAKVQDAETIYQKFQIELRQAEKTRKDLVISAPFDGIVGIPKVEIGDQVETTKPIITLDDRRDLLVEFELPEKFIAQITTGAKISATTPGFSRTKFAGRIENIDSRVDPTSRTVTIRAVIPNDADRLRPGMSFTVELLLAGEEFPAVPELALQWRKGESFVWKIENGKAKKTIVETIKRENSTILVSGQLATGDLVVVEGVQRLRPGTAVKYGSADVNKNAPGQTPVSAQINDGQRS